ncbi:MAG: hypothetical protein ACOX8B_01395 [Lachnospiraceae bacterium]|jgi:hypothetical protein
MGSDSNDDKDSDLFRPEKNSGENDIFNTDAQDSERGETQDGRDSGAGESGTAAGGNSENYSSGSQGSSTGSESYAGGSRGSGENSGSYGSGSQGSSTGSESYAGGSQNSGENSGSYTGSSRESGGPADGSGSAAGGSQDYSESDRYDPWKEYNYERAHQKRYYDDEGHPVPPPPEKSNRLSRIALFLSLISIPLCCCSPYASIVSLIFALVLAIMSKFTNNRRKRMQGPAIAALIISIVLLILIIGSLIITYVLLPYLLEKYPEFADYYNQLYNMLNNGGSGSGALPLPDAGTAAETTEAATEAETQAASASPLT